MEAGLLRAFQTARKLPRFTDHFVCAKRLRLFGWLQRRMEGYVIPAHLRSKIYLIVAIFAPDAINPSEPPKLPQSQPVALLQKPRPGRRTDG